MHDEILEVILSFVVGQSYIRKHYYYCVATGGYSSVLKNSIDLLKPLKHIKDPTSEFLQHIPSFDIASVPEFTQTEVL